MAIAEFTIYKDAVVAALEADDYTTALKEARKAHAELAGVPNVDKDGFSVSYERQQMEYMIEDIKKAQNAAVVAATGGWQRTKVTYVEATD